MIQLITREEVFYKSWVVDHYISDLQKKQCRGYQTVHSGHASLPKETRLDHFECFHDNIEVLDDFAVIGYVVKSQLDYLTHRSNAFIRFFELIGIRQLYLFDELKNDWVQFDFKSSEKREEMKRIVNQPAYSEAFILDIDDLRKFLPLFNFSGRNSVPIIWLFSADTQMPLATYLCDDGNFHTSFFSKDREKLTSAASAAGLKMGGIEICRM